MSRADDLKPLFAKKPNTFSYKQGILTSWNPGDGTNTVDVGNATLTNVRVLNPETAGLEVGSAVGLVRDKFTWCIIGRILTPPYVLEGGGGSDVTSVNGHTGAVVLGAADVGAATAAQGALADSAVQPGDLATVATSGAYSDLSGRPAIPDSADDIGAVPTTRTVSAGTGLTGGGDLSANRSLAVSYGTTAGTAAQGNDSRITGAVPSTRSITAGTGLSGGGTLAADRSLAVTYGTTAGTAAQGNDSRLSNARTPTAHASTHANGGSDEVVLDGSQITSGLVPFTQLPTGITATTVAIGNHTHAGGGTGAVDSVNGMTGDVVLDAADVGAATSAQGAEADTAVQPGDLAAIATSGSASDLSTGTTPFARLPTGTTSSTVAIGSHDHAGQVISPSEVISIKNAGVDPAIYISELGNTHETFGITNEGWLYWGDGSQTGGDINLRRSTTETIATSGNLKVENDLTVSGTLNRPTFEAASSGNVVLSTTATDVPDATITFTTDKANTKVLVSAVFDFGVGSSGTLANIAVGEIVVDGTAQPSQALMGISALNLRSTVSQNALVTLASIGSHTIKLQVSRSGSGGTASCTCRNLHTTIIAHVVD